MSKDAESLVAPRSPHWANMPKRLGQLISGVQVAGMARFLDSGHCRPEKRQPILPCSRLWRLIFGHYGYRLPVYQLFTIQSESIHKVDHL
jgi:hypothetical protein